MSPTLPPGRFGNARLAQVVRARLLVGGLALAGAAFCGLAHAWKEPAWTLSDRDRAAHSDAVFVATVESVADTALRIAGEHALRRALVRVEQVVKPHPLLQARHPALFFEAPHSPGPDRAWISVAAGQKAVFYARERRLKTGATVLFLDFQSDVQPP